jgi:hypothetical protein
MDYCNETSQESSLGCVDVHLGFTFSKWLPIAMVTMTIKKYFFGSDCNETSQG